MFSLNQIIFMAFRISFLKKKIIYQKDRDTGKTRDIRKLSHSISAKSAEKKDMRTDKNGVMETPTLLFVQNQVALGNVLKRT